MRLLSFITLFCIQFMTTSVCAASYELNIAELIQNQNIIQTLRIEADNLTAKITLNNGQTIDALASDTWPLFFETAQISVTGPNVLFKLVTQDGNEWERVFSSFNLLISNLVRDGRREVTLDLHAIPFKEIGKQINKKTTLNLAQFLLKAFILGAEGEIHFKLQASAALEENAHPLMKIELEQNGQSLSFEMQAQQDGLKIGVWKIRGNGFGKGSITELLLTALRNMSEECRKLNPKTDYEVMLQTVFYGVDLFLDLTAPIVQWDGITVSAQGSFDYQSKDVDTFSTHLNNHFQLTAYDGSWSAQLGSKTYASVGMKDSPALTQQFIISNPASDIEKIAQWIQTHWVDQLATVLNMPSIKYYAYYFPTYFGQGLVMVMLSLGEPQEDGTITFTLSGSTLGSFEISKTNVSDLGALVIKKIKGKTGGW
ncbi:hypothetical protein [Legionella tunisiensis]|uniref:hypothetical protein n=1 Tax=Legionella tunisiensis TaxID=1034944 RepID=UPI000318C206|nr:hypothetical protein [Legionella tunisiensis]